MDPMDGASTVERMMISHAKQSRTPINGSLELLPLCNMNCDMCYVRLSRKEMEQKGRMRRIDEWLELGRQMQKAGVLFLLLTGGEPLLYPGFRELYLEFKKMGMILTINTNATLIDEETAAFFGKHKPRRVNVTLYGCDDRAYRELCHYPGGFGKALNGIRLLRKYGVDVKVSSSLTRANKNDMERILAIGKELEVPVRIDTYMLPAARERNKPYDLQSRVNPVEAAQVRVKVLKEEMGADLFRKYVETCIFEIDHRISGEDSTRHMACLAGSCSFTINWQGEMRPCVILSGPSAPVFERGFEAAWHDIAEETDKILLSSKCSACRMRSLCRTCAASALLETGSYEGTPEYMCQYTEESLRLLRMEAEKIRHG